MTAVNIGSQDSGRPGPIRFGLRFLALFIVLMGGFEGARGTAFERVVIEDGVLMPAVHVINTLSRSTDVRLNGRTIVSPSSRLRILRGCEGVEMFLLLFAAILAFPTSWQHRLRGLIVGSIIAYGLTIGRLLALHATLRYSPPLWDAMHGLILPLGPIVLVAIYFLHWTGRAGRAGPIATTA